jgi:phenylalanyl-tRNA synthetase beta subunit
LRPVPPRLVEEVAREFQLDEIEPTSPLAQSSANEKELRAEKMARNLDELLSYLRSVDLVPSKERKP